MTRDERRRFQATLDGIDNAAIAKGRLPIPLHQALHHLHRLTFKDVFVMTPGAHLLLLSFILVSMSPDAAPIIYTDRNAFQAAVTGTLLGESFETPLPGVNTGTADYVHFSVAETGGINTISTTDSLEPAAVTDGTAALSFKDNGNSIGVFYDFDSIQAFGFDLTVVDGSATTDIVISGDISHAMTLTKRVPAFIGVFDPNGLLNGIEIDTAGEPAVYIDHVQYMRSDANPVSAPKSTLLWAALPVLVWGRSHWRSSITMSALD